MTTTRIDDASTWEQQLYDHLVGHTEAERELVDAYRELIEDPPTPAVGYLARVIVSDEERHHRQFAELAEAVRAFAEARVDESPIPLLAAGRAPAGERRRVLELTERFLAAERDDLRDLDGLTEDLEDVAETTLWSLLVSLMRTDTEKHIRILEFIRDRALEERPPL